MKYYDALTKFIFVEDEPLPSDYIFIPGSGYGELAQKAAELYRAGMAMHIVVSGRYSILGDSFAGPVSPKEYVGWTFETECDFLTRVLTDRGVPASAVLQERRARYTYENAIYTAGILKNETVKRAILVCQAFHARRSLLYYQILFPNTEFLVCPVNTRGITRDNWHLDAEKIDVVLGEVERCGSQFHEIMKEHSMKNERKLPE
ncbi:MAG: YdcF family protein [Eubacteriales bacterium]|nr:YdcF family protein [Eubacteriales bacterium]